jgi:hypothetical protein
VVFRKNDSEICITYEFSSKYEFTNGYIEWIMTNEKKAEIQKKDVGILNWIDVSKNKTKTPKTDQCTESIVLA